MTFEFDRRTTLEALGEGLYRVPAGQAYWNFQSAFGGWAVALAVKAVQADPDVRGELVSLSALLTDAIPDEDLFVRVTKLRAKARTDFWRAEILKAPDADHIIFSSDIVMTKRRASKVEYHLPMLEIAEPSTFPEMDVSMAPKWMGAYEQHMVVGNPFGPNETPRTVIWIREKDGRPWDSMSVAAIADSFMPRVFFVSEDPRFGSTVSFSVNILATNEEISEAGSDYLLLEGDSDMVRNGAFDQHGRIWSRNGRLLATTNQVAFFR